jgi:hypothetical protein
MKNPRTLPSVRTPVERPSGPRLRKLSASRKNHSPDAWITDPQSLLLAMASAERAAIAATQPQPRRTVAPCDPLPAPPVAPRELGRLPTPMLREDERIGRASSEGVLVIIRRRRAA